MIYAISDIYGQANRFHDLLRKIDLKSNDKLYILGNVIDGNPGGLALLLEIMSMDNAFMVPGNHEYMMLKSIGSSNGNCPLIFANNHSTTIWAYNGGSVTADEFKTAGQDNRKKIIQFLRGLKYEYDEWIDGKHYKLVHSATLDSYKRWLQNSQFPNCAYTDADDYRVWHRMREQDFVDDYIVVHGHTPSSEYYPKVTNKQIVELENRNDTKLKDEYMDLYEDGFDDEKEAVTDTPVVSVKSAIYVSDKEIAINCGETLKYDTENKHAYAPSALACICLDTGEEFYSSI